MKRSINSYIQNYGSFLLQVLEKSAMLQVLTGVESGVLLHMA
jgi:hypothetical protein